MNTAVRLKVDMAVRVRHFLRANPFSAPKAEAVAAKFEERLARAETLLQQQGDGRDLARTSRAARSGLRQRLRNSPLRHLARIAAAAAAVKPELAELFKLPGASLSEQDFRTGLRNTLARVATHQELLIEHGLRETLPAELTEMVERYEQVAALADAGRRGHTGARTELQGLASELVRMVKQLDGMMLYRIQEQPELAGAWISARNVAWPSPVDKTPDVGPEANAA